LFGNISQKWLKKWDRRRAAEIAFADPLPLQHAEETSKIVEDLKIKVQAQHNAIANQERELNWLRCDANGINAAVSMSEDVRKTAEELIEGAQRVLDECDKAAATHAAFGAGAFDALADLKL